MFHNRMGSSSSSELEGWKMLRGVFVCACLNNNEEQFVKRGDGKHVIRNADDDCLRFINHRFIPQNIYSFLLVIREMI